MDFPPKCGVLDLLWIFLSCLAKCILHYMWVIVVEAWFKHVPHYLWLARLALAGTYCWPLHPCLEEALHCFDHEISFPAIFQTPQCTRNKCYCCYIHIRIWYNLPSEQCHYPVWQECDLSAARTPACMIMMNDVNLHVMYSCELNVYRGNYSNLQ